MVVFAGYSAGFGSGASWLGRRPASDEKKEDRQSLYGASKPRLRATVLPHVCANLNGFAGLYSLWLAGFRARDR